jgi:D-alanine-D-alanine ligase-like ATP-grasp enzyme
MNTMIESVKNACNILNISYEDPQGEDISVRLDINGKYFYCIYNKHFFNRTDIQVICTDKDYTYSLLQGRVAYPRYKRYLEVNGARKQGFNPDLVTNEEIVEDIPKNFQFPMIVKMNRGSLGKNVFKCLNIDDVKTAVDRIFQKDEPRDNLLLAQEYIDIKHEYRVITYKGNIEFIYEKDISNASFNGNLSPLHWDGGKAILVEDKEIIKNMQDFISPIFPIIPVTFAGLDIVEDLSGNYWFIEINGNPMFKVFARDCGSEKLDILMVKILSDYLQKDK